MPSGTGTLGRIGREGSNVCGHPVREAVAKTMTDMREEPASETDPVARPVGSRVGRRRLIPGRSRR